MRSRPSLHPCAAFSLADALLRPLLRVTLRERRLKGRLVAQAAVQPGHRVLDIGCGTGTLALMVKKACPGAEVVGLDADPGVLARARRKASDAGLEVEFREGLATAPPFEPASFDRVVSSLFFHHLRPRDKRLALRRTHELLRSSGELHVADWGTPHGPFMRAAFLAVQLLDGFATTSDSVRGRLPTYMEQVGFWPVFETGKERTLYGSLVFHQAFRPY